MVNHKRWTDEEITFLEEKWGVYSIKNIAKNLGHSINAVKLKASKLGLDDPRLHYDGITLNQLADALGVMYSQVITWVEKYNFPYREKVFGISKRTKVVRYEDFWKWAKNHKQMIDFSRLEPLLLGAEPDWVNIKRAADTMAFTAKGKSRIWTKEDISKLKGMCNSGVYTCSEIATRLKRTEAAIRRKMRDLGIVSRCIKRQSNSQYTDEQIEILLKMVQQGYSLNTIADKIGKSAIGIRGKLERMGYSFKNNVPVLKGDKIILPSKNWKDKDIEFLKENHEKMSPSELANVLGKTRQCVYSKLVKMGLPVKLEIKKWTKEELEYLRQHQDEPISVLANELGRTKFAIVSKMSTLKEKGRKLWTQSDVTELEKLCKELTIEEIVSNMNSSKESIQKKCLC